MFTLLVPLLLVQAAPLRDVQIAPPVKLVARSSTAQALSPDGKELAFNVELQELHHDRDYVSVRFVSLSTGKVRLSVPCPADHVEDLAWSPEGESIALVTRDGIVRFIRASDGATEAAFDTSSPGRSVRFVDGGTKLLLTGAQWRAELRRHDGSLVAGLLIKPDTAIAASCVSADGLHFALGDEAGSFATYSAQTGALEAGPFFEHEKVNTLSLDAHGQWLAVGAAGCSVRVVRASLGGAEWHTLSHCDQDLVGNLQIGSVQFGPDGQTLLTTSFPFWEVRMWNAIDGTLAWHYDFGVGNPGPIAAMFTNDPSIVVVSKGGDVVDALSGKVCRTLASVSTPFYQCSSAGQYAWSSEDSRLRIFNVHDAKLVADVDLREPVPK